MLFQSVVNISYYQSAIPSLFTRIRSLLFARNNILVAQFVNWKKANGLTELHYPVSRPKKADKRGTTSLWLCTGMFADCFTTYCILKRLNTYFNSTEWSDDKWTFMEIFMAILVSTEVNWFSEIRYNWIDWMHGDVALPEIDLTWYIAFLESQDLPRWFLNFKNWEAC